MRSGYYAHARSSLRHRHQLDDVAVVVLVIEATAAIPIVELSVFKAPGPASEGEPSVLDSLQDRVEFGVAYVKRVMLAWDSPLRVGEVQRQCVVDAHRRKVTACTLEAQPQELREESSVSLLVASPNYGVVECHRHGLPPTRPPGANPSRALL